jgi:hypothetical protein
MSQRGEDGKLIEDQREQIRKAQAMYAAGYTLGENPGGSYPGRAQSQPSDRQSHLKG